ncbi:unnamed protein product [Microthlaspi erraticum]|uniref:Uncharacterized protein n=1 Tax=Microthlaspi erraticum TaxID=1685480 RepID=A0A6D2IYB8_9BRAS|nr:unnamed protein product [Microthlaspi erraticum]
MEISYLDKQEGYENSAPQRTGRQGRGGEGSGHQEHSTRHLSSIELAAPWLDRVVPRVNGALLKPVPARLSQESQR